MMNIIHEDRLMTRLITSLNMIDLKVLIQIISNNQSYKGEAIKLIEGRALLIKCLNSLLYKIHNNSNKYSHLHLNNNSNNNHNKIITVMEQIIEMKIYCVQY